MCVYIYIYTHTHTHTHTITLCADWHDDDGLCLVPSGRTRWIPNNRENRHAKNAHSLPTFSLRCTMQHSLYFYYPGYHIGNKAGLIARRGDGTVKSSARQPLPSPSFLAFPCMQQPLFPPFPRATPPPIRRSSSRRHVLCNPSRQLTPPLISPHHHRKDS